MVRRSQSSPTFFFRALVRVCAPVAIYENAISINGSSGLHTRNVYPQRDSRACNNANFHCVARIITKIRGLNIRRGAAVDTMDFNKLLVKKKTHFDGTCHARAFCIRYTLECAGAIVWRCGNAFYLIEIRRRARLRCPGIIRTGLVG